MSHLKINNQIKELTNKAGGVSAVICGRDYISIYPLN